MPESGESRTVIDWHPAARFYRRPPGIGWLAALIVVPLLLGVIARSGSQGTEPAGPEPPNVAASATLTPSSAAGPEALVAPFSLRRNGNDVTLTGQVPDDQTRAYVLDQTRTALPGTNVLDLLSPIEGITAADMTGLAGVLRVAAPMSDFGFSIEGGNVVLYGSAQSEEIRTQIEAATRAAWPELGVLDDIAVLGTDAAPAPGSGLTGDCTGLQQDISALLRTPVQFGTDGSTLARTSEPLIVELAAALNVCPDVRVTVIGHTDNLGTAAVNEASSTSSAKAVADGLVANGVAADRVTARGAGSADPIATNDTAEGRSQNRRVEIVVSPGAR